MVILDWAHLILVSLVCRKDSYHDLCIYIGSRSSYLAVSIGVLCMDMDGLCYLLP